MASLSELLEPISKEEFEELIYDAMEARGVGTTSWKSGAWVRTIVAALAIVLSGFSQLTKLVTESGFLDNAENEWLDIVALFVYGVERDEGTFAEGVVILDNGGGGVFSVAVGDMIVKNTGTGKTFRNTEAFTLASLETGKEVSVVAIEKGSGPTSAAGEIDGFETELLGVAVTNTNALVGSDPEGDEALRTRCRAKIGQLSPNGPKDAYRFAALESVLSSGVPAGITRVTTVADGAGGIEAVVGTASGPVAGTVGDLDSALGAADDAMQRLAVPDAVTLTTTSAVAVTLDFTYELWVKSTIGLTSSEIESNISLALAAYLAVQPIGGLRKVAGDGFIFREALEGVIKSEVGKEHLIDLVTAVPASDVALLYNEAATLGTVTPTTNIIGD